MQKNMLQRPTGAKSAFDARGRLSCARMLETPFKIEFSAVFGDTFLMSLLFDS